MFALNVVKFGHVKTVKSVQTDGQKGRQTDGRRTMDKKCSEKIT